METFDRIFLITAKLANNRIRTRVSCDGKLVEKKRGGMGGGSGGAVVVKNTNRLMDTTFEKSQVEKLLNELLARYITVSYYLI